MPIYKEISPGIREVHTAERLQVSFKESGENVDLMQFKVFFTVQIQKVEGEGIVNLGPPYLDLVNPLTLSSADDQDIKFAAQIFQQKIGELRHAQLHAPPPAPVEEPEVSPVQ